MKDNTELSQLPKSPNNKSIIRMKKKKPVKLKHDSKEDSSSLYNYNESKKNVFKPTNKIRNKSSPYKKGSGITVDSSDNLSQNGSDANNYYSEFLVKNQKRGASTNPTTRFGSPTYQYAINTSKTLKRASMSRSEIINVMKNNKTSMGRKVTNGTKANEKFMKDMEEIYNDSEIEINSSNQKKNIHNSEINQLKRRNIGIKGGNSIEKEPKCFSKSTEYRRKKKVIKKRIPVGQHQLNLNASSSRQLKNNSYEIGNEESPKISHSAYISMTPGPYTKKNFGGNRTNQMNLGYSKINRSESLSYPSHFFGIMNQNSPKGQSIGIASSHRSRNHRQSGFRGNLINLDDSGSIILEGKERKKNQKSWSPYNDQRRYLPSIVSMKQFLKSKRQKYISKTPEINKKLKRKESNRKNKKKNHKRKENQHSFFSKNPASHYWNPYDEQRKYIIKRITEER